MKSQVTVSDVNEHSPQFTPTTAYSATVSENESAGYSVLVVSASDDDTQENIRIFTITAGNDDAKFIIDSYSGQIQVNSSTPAVVYFPLWHSIHLFVMQY